MLDVMLVVSLFWCRAEPVVANGDEYLRRASSIDMACIEAVDACEKQYHDCEPRYCGEGYSLNYDDEPCEI